MYVYACVVELCGVCGVCACVVCGRRAVCGVLAHDRGMRGRMVAAAHAEASRGCPALTILSCSVPRALGGVVDGEGIRALCAGRLPKTSLHFTKRTQQSDFS